MLREVLKCDDLVSRFRVLVGRIKGEYLRFWQTHAPHYTDHGETHHDSVEKNLNELIPKPILRDMNEYEVFLLLCAVWLHDIGMMVREPGESIKEVRAVHHHRCIRIIKEKFSDLLNEHERVIVGEIARAHREINLRTLDEMRSIRHIELGNQRIRIRFLAALLRLADSCDICATRAKTDVSEWPEEARFYHLLHRRVSGISFMHETASLEIDMLAEKDFDREVLKEFVTNKLRSELESVQEILMRNGVNYFLKENFSKPIEPQPMIEVPPKMLEEWQKRTRGEITFFISRGDPIHALESCKKLHLIGGKIPLEVAMEITRLFEERKSYLSAVDVLKFCLKQYPDDKLLWTRMGIIKCEHLFDWEGAYGCFKKTIEIDPKDEGLTLDFAETCVLTKKYDDAYSLATQICETTSDLVNLINAKLIQIWSLYLMGREEEGLKTIQVLTSMMPRKFRKYNPWGYNAISKFLQESELQHSVKSMLLDLISVVSKEGRKSIEEFRSTWLWDKTQ